jgi:hypothetical protein
VWGGVCVWGGGGGRKCKVPLGDLCDVCERPWSVRVWRRAVTHLVNLSKLGVSCCRRSTEGDEVVSGNDRPPSLREPTRRRRQKHEPEKENDGWNALSSYRPLPPVLVVLQGPSDPERYHDASRH